MSIHRKQLKGRVSYQVQWRDKTGRQKSKRFRTLKEAQAWEGQIRIDKYRGLNPSREGTKVMFADYAERWRSTKSEHRPRTAVRRDQILRLYLKPALGSRTLASISTKDINDLILRWQNSLKPRTIANHIHILGPIFDMAVSEDLIQRNPVTHATFPEPTPVKRHSLTSDDFHQLLQEIPEQYRDFICFLALTGMRFSEATSVRLCDIDFDTKTVKVTQSKTEAGIREISLSDTELELLKKYVSTYRTGVGPDDKLFVTKNGAGIHHSNFNRRVFRPASIRASLGELVIHDLRRTHATLLAENSASPTAAHQRMGHLSYATTQKYYILPTTNTRQQTAGIVSRALGIDPVHGSEQG